MKTFLLRRLNIGPRLTLCFVFIILMMLAGNAILLWQFDRERAQAERLSRVDQKYIVVLQAHINLLSAHERLDALAHFDARPLPVGELETLQREIVDGSRRSKDALSRLPAETPTDMASLPTLIAIQDILPAQLEAVTALAKSGDWGAVRLRLTNQVRPLEALSSSLVEAIDREVGDERSQIVANIGRTERRMLLIVPMTAAILLAFATLLGMVITRSITQPLSRLMDGSRALGRREFDHRVAIAGSDELAHLGQVFNETAATLRDTEEALNNARADLARVSRVTTLSALTASIAHEVNQPLAGIITNAGTCLRMLDAATPDVDGARETARRTIRDGNRAADVIARLRALFSKRALTLEPLDLNEATREVIALSSNDFQRNRIVLQSELAHELPIISADRIQLQHVILNLLRNAADAMVDVHDRPRHLRIRTEREGADRVLFTVRDVGVGLPAQSVDSLFDAFYTTKSGGMGIGLFVSRSIVEQHHGRLWAEPNQGPGATFSFSVPCRQGDAPQALRTA